MAGKYVTESDGVYTKVPTAGPLSMEIFVEQGQTLSTSYHGFRKTLEAEPNRASDPFYMNVYHGLDHAASTKGKKTHPGNEYASFLTPEGKTIRAMAQMAQDVVDARQAGIDREKLRALSLKSQKRDREREMKERRERAAVEVTKRLEEYKEKNKKEASKSARAVIEKQVAKDWHVDEEEEEEAEEEAVEVKKKGTKRVRLELPE